MNRIKKTIRGFPAASAIFLICCYKAGLGRYLGGQCRFVPSCSDYAIEAIRKFGIFRGGFKSLWRILRCNPFGAKGYDPPGGI